MYWKVLFGSALFCVLPFWGWAQAQNDLVRQIDSAMKTLQGFPTLESGDCVLEDGENCSFSQMCAVVRQNRNSKNLYRSPDGRYFPNFGLISLEKRLAECRDRQSDQDQLNSVYESWSRQRNQARKNLLSSVLRHHEEKDYVKVELALAQLPDGEIGADPLRNIAAAERAAGVRLSRETRQKWLAVLAPPPDEDGPDDDVGTSVAGDDPYLNPELLLRPQSAGSEKKMRAFRREFQQNVDRAYGLFKDSQKRIIAALKKRRTSGNAEQIDGMIRRIETIKFSVPMSLDKRSLSQSECASPNAFYDQTKHTFNICPQILNVPDIALQQVIAHEMGHSIDPCTLADPLYRLSNAAERGESEGMNSEAVFQLPVQPDENYGASNKETLLAQWSNPNGKPAVSEVSEGLGLSRNPLSSVVRCLGSEESVHARMADLGKARRDLERQIQFLRHRGAGEDTPKLRKLEATLARLQSYEDRRACSELPGKSQMQEAFADWVADEVVASRIEEADTSAEKKQIAFESAGFFISMDCATTTPDISAADQALLEKGDCQQSLFDQDMANLKEVEERDEHPDSSLRVDRILLAHPIIQKALGCSPVEKGRHCD